MTFFNERGNAEVLEKNKAYLLIIPESGKVEKVGYFGEKGEIGGVNNYFLYGFVPGDYVNRIKIMSLRERQFLTDGKVISPFLGREWGKVQSFWNLEEDTRNLSSKLLQKMRELGLIDQGTSFKPNDRMNSSIMSYLFKKIFPFLVR